MGLSRFSFLSTFFALCCSTGQIAYAAQDGEMGSSSTGHATISVVIEPYFNIEKAKANSEKIAVTAHGFEYDLVEVKPEVTRLGTINLRPQVTKAQLSRLLVVVPR